MVVVLVVEVVVIVIVVVVVVVIVVYNYLLFVLMSRYSIIPLMQSFTKILTKSNYNISLWHISMF